MTEQLLDDSRNALETLNREFRRRTKTQASFATEDAARAVRYGLAFLVFRLPLAYIPHAAGWLEIAAIFCKSEMPDAEPDAATPVKWIESYSDRKFGRPGFDGSPSATMVVVKKTVEAVYENGVFRPLKRPEGIAEHRQVTLTVTAEEQPCSLADLAGRISANDAEDMRSIVEREFERVDLREWH